MTVPAPTTAQRRQALIEQLFPGGMPTLWCPPLTHYDADGSLDRHRIVKHLRSIAPYVKGLLVPGSTGDAWELSAAEQRQVLDLVLEAAGDLGLHVLVGVLCADAEEARQAVIETLAWLAQRHPDALPHQQPQPRGRAHNKDAGGQSAAAGAARICGFTVCPPAGGDLSQEEIHRRLAAILALGVPTALYQLPQVTRNEVAPQSVADLAGRYANFYLLKDTSGRDRVATSGLDLHGLCLLRGAEGDYGRWLRAGGGPYAGFLLSTANCFAPQLHRMIEHLNHGRLPEAQQVIGPVERVVARVFELVAGVPDGNPFTNANKAIDHFLAHGPEAAAAAPPRLHAGSSLPEEVIGRTGQVLAECGLMPHRGYLAGD